jgi:hypothetical protein
MTVSSNRLDPRTDVGVATEATENAERVRPGIRPVPSVVSVRSVVQCRIQGRTDIDVCDNERARPTIRVTGWAEKILEGSKVHQSNSQLPGYAAAVVIDD